MASVEENVPVKENSVEEKSTEKTATKPSPQVDYPAFWKIGLAFIFFFLSLFIMIVKNMVRSDDFVILFPAIVGGVAILAHITLKLFGKKNTYFYPMLIIFVAIIVLAGFYNGFIMVEDKVDEDGAERSGIDNDSYFLGFCNGAAVGIAIIIFSEPVVLKFFS